MYEVFGKLKKKYNSSKISKGVAKGFAGSPIIDGSNTAKPIVHAIVPKITAGKILQEHIEIYCLTYSTIFSLGNTFKKS